LVLGGVEDNLLVDVVVVVGDGAKGRGRWGCAVGVDGSGSISIKLELITDDVVRGVVVVMGSFRLLPPIMGIIAG